MLLAVCFRSFSVSKFDRSFADLDCCVKQSIKRLSELRGDFVDGLVLGLGHLEPHVQDEQELDDDEEQEHERTQRFLQEGTKSHVMKQGKNKAKMDEVT